MKYIYLVLVVLGLLSGVSEGGNLTNTVFVSFDTETTGLSATHERLVEIGAVKFRGDTIIATTNWLINPGRPIPKGVIRVHGITDKMVKHAPKAGEALREFKKFIGDAPLIAHNARFDVGFIAHECHRSGVKIPKNPVIDSLVLSRRYLPEAPAHNLVALSEYLKLKDMGHHRALADSVYVAEMMPLIFSKMRKNAGVSTLKRIAGMPFSDVSVGNED